MRKIKSVNNKEQIDFSCLRFPDNSILSQVPTKFKVIIIIIIKVDTMDGVISKQFLHKQGNIGTRLCSLFYILSRSHLALKRIIRERAYLLRRRKSSIK